MHLFVKLLKYAFAYAHMQMHNYPKPSYKYKIKILECVVLKTRPQCILKYKTRLMRNTPSMNTLKPLRVH